MGKIETRNIVERTLEYMTRLIGDGALSQVGKESLSEEQALAQGTWATLLRVCDGNEKAKNYLMLYEQNPEDQVVKQGLVLELTTTLQLQPELILNWNQFIARAYAMGLLNVQPNRNHNNTAGGDAQIGVEVVGDMSGNINQPQGDIVGTKIVYEYPRAEAKNVVSIIDSTIKGTEKNLQSELIVAIGNSQELVQYIPKIYDAEEPSKDVISKTHKLSESLGNSSDIVWSQREVNIPLINELKNLLVYYDERLLVIDEFDVESELTQQVYLILVRADQISSALRLEERGESTAGYILRRLGRRAIRVGDILESENLFRRSDLLIKPDDSIEYAMLLRDKSILKIRDGKAGDAYKISQKAAEIAEIAGIANLGEFFSILMITAFDSNNISVYSRYYRKAIIQYKSVRDENKIYNLKQNYALTLIYLGKPEEALDEIKRLYEKGVRNDDLILSNALAFTEINRPYDTVDILKPVIDSFQMVEEKDQILEIRILTALIDANLSILRIKFSQYENEGIDYYDSVFLPLYQEIHGKTQDLDDDGIMAELIDVEIFLGEAGLLVGEKSTSGAAIAKAAYYINKLADREHIPSRVRYNLIKARITQGDLHKDRNNKTAYNLAIKMCDEAIDLAQSYSIARLMLVPALITTADIALSFGDIWKAEQAIAQAQTSIDRRISRHRIQEFELIRTRVREAQVSKGSGQ